ncbi:YncE family protein [Deinococcus cellulosilyticus]|uniref:Uncharacterized protein n=1 Tax=Deinococcus cellulosilyticus (strain DSM 18568 / NBRC 106333 / KACC 11606 / 5516J-15) TaxID=1223518 RepID=A0A511MYI5_DEIC1|nr:hypothetical protein [Deinococcus cellulosilyticus]GEM45633.1 hypothetical protein DC3_12680 [Deinococcus cellulosilyticus NBRC 106333 = KACC 11606]
MSRDGSTALTYPEQVAYDALSGDLLQERPVAKRNIGISDLSEDGTYGLQVSSPEDSKGFIYQIVDVASGEVKATLPGLFMPNDPHQNAPTFLSHDPKSHRLAVGYWNNTVRVLNTMTWETQQTLDLYGRAEGYVGLHLSGRVLHYVTPSQVGTYTLSDGRHQQTECLTHGFEQALFHDGLWILGTHGMTTVLQGNDILWQSEGHDDGPDESCSVHLWTSDAQTFTGQLVWRGETFQLSGQLQALRFPLRMDLKSEIRWESTLLDPQGQVAGRLSAHTHHGKQSRLGKVLHCAIWRGELHTSGYLLPDLAP